MRGEKRAPERGLDAERAASAWEGSFTFLEGVQSDPTHDAHPQLRSRSQNTESRSGPLEREVLPIKGNGVAKEDRQTSPSTVSAACYGRLSLPRRVVNLRRRKVTLHFGRHLAKPTSGSFWTFFWQSPKRSGDLEIISDLEKIPRFAQEI
ncbi:hypothetical protein NPIL_368871 [Nephila pilipes]|uniref:Uncharacterized protein n=1 Tax=Nephila pilipes TaxID=299642 RepID=A0A8X6NVW9_NEPPI|nr:hypothetical protein NPIL_368871 [Nephila pilipes]